jgi:hypothetical protein
VRSFEKPAFGADPGWRPSIGRDYAQPDRDFTIVARLSRGGHWRHKSDKFRLTNRGTHDGLLVELSLTWAVDARLVMRFLPRGVQTGRSQGRPFHFPII